VDFTHARGILRVPCRTTPGKSTFQPDASGSRVANVVSMGDQALGTTNLMLAIIAAVSVLEAVVLMGVVVAAWRAYTRSMELVARAHQQMSPLVDRVNGLADRIEGVAADVKDITARVATNTARAEAAVNAGVALVSYGIGGASASVGRNALRLYSVVRGVRAAFRSLAARDTDSVRASRGG
jgi:hypothetical protein